MFLFPNRLNPVSVENEIVRRDQRETEMPCSRYDYSIGGVANSSKTE